MTESARIDLRKRLTVLAKSRRVSTISDTALNTEPQSSRNDMVYHDGRLVKRKRVVLLTPRCRSATCTMCPLPNEGVDVRRRAISSADIARQINSVFSSMDGDTELVTLYNNGNFFADSEITPEVRNLVYRKIKDSNARILLVESLPQFITAEKLNECKEILQDKKLIVAIGLQSSDDTVRELAVNTTCTRFSFERAVNLLAERGFGAQAFLMVKPPFVTEKEAVEDVVKSIRYLSSLGIYNPILCTTRVAPNTVLALMEKSGHFQSPWMWTVIDTLKESSRVNLRSHPRVVISELESDKNPDSKCSKNCNKCGRVIIDSLIRYNESGSVTQLDKLDCECRNDYLASVEEESLRYFGQSIEMRIADFLKNLGV